MYVILYGRRLFTNQPIPEDIVRLATAPLPDECRSTVKHDFANITRQTSTCINL